MEHIDDIQDVEEPSNAPLLIYFGVVVALGVAGVIFELVFENLVGNVIGYVLAALALVVLIGGFAVGEYAVGILLGRTDKPSKSPDPETRPLGTMLDCPIDEHPMPLFVRALGDEDRTALEQVRAGERQLTEGWFSQIDSAERVDITAEDGSNLAGFVIESNPDSGKWVIGVHGYKGMWPEFMMHARRYGEAGYNVLMPQLRGHGNSGGAFVGLGYLDRRDIVLWSRWLVDQGVSSIVLHGHSMGGATVCMASAELDLPHQVKATVSDCAYSDIWNVALDYAKDNIKYPIHPIIDLARFVFMHMKGGFDVSKASPETCARNIHVPLLLLHGDSDAFVKPYMSQRIFDQADGDKQLVYIPSGGHCLACFADPDLYYSTVFEFLKSRI